MAFTKRGLRLVKALEQYPKDKPVYFDTINILNKVGNAIYKNPDFVPSYNGIKFTASTDEHLKATMIVDRSMCNGLGTIHGGCIALILDIICLYGNLGKNNGKMALTTNMYINFISPASIGEKIIAEAKTVKGGENSIMESYLFKENGALLAKGTVSFKNFNDQFQKEASHVLGFDILKTDD